MKILLAAPEVYPFISTGGLSGVTGSLPAALENAGLDVSVIMPFYRDCRNLGDYEWVGGHFLTSAGEEFGLASTLLPGSSVEVLLVSRNSYFNRPGIYGPDSGSAFPDNSARFAFFCRAVSAVCDSLDKPVDVLHCHDWQTGLVPAYMRNYRRPATVFTIHNAQYQGNFPPEEYPTAMLPWPLFSPEGMEFYGTFSFLKSGIVFSDAVTTVSRTYAEELGTPKYGEGMDGIIRTRSNPITGILNGIDYGVWNPSDDPHIACFFSITRRPPRKACRNDLCNCFGLDPESDRMIIGMVTRLSSQKGLELLFPVIDSIVRDGISLVVLGTGESKYESRLLELAEVYPGRVAPMFRDDEAIARKIFAGCDLFLMPSLFEPCGLAQMMAMRYGAVPLVRATGGLADTVTDIEDDGCGFVFENADSEELLETIVRARRLFTDRRRWSWLVRKCMSIDNSWGSRAEPYLEVFRKAILHRGEL